MLEAEQMKPVRREDGRMVLNIDNEKDLRTYMQRCV